MTEKEAYKECVDAIQSAEKRFFVNLYSELFFHFWQAAWEARGKHDADVCRQIQKSLSGFYAAYSFMNEEGEECAKAIEEQD